MDSRCLSEPASASAQLQLLDELLYTWSALIFKYDRFGDPSVLNDFETYLKDTRKELLRKTTSPGRY